ncbi:hypothetical protein [Caldisericum exile]|uniref:AmmeMemoRadiSam system radical SAM enzyme n=1 Tax=Caldisericum exile (strain DSM 21853 / NBRC 104410 / AZM16c01) TaxID=511051 RepID=A0A7U6GET8_CALEA|nr:hypothetical protein [Caldisericum exile]BAL81083.1 hypothetical protein CSE_09570 [Caldisericum exile AZM16c01]
MDEALLWEPLEGNKVRCNLCNFRCAIPDGKSGICKVRINKSGKLYTLLNSYVSSWALDPIEKSLFTTIIQGALSFHLEHGGVISVVVVVKIMKFPD